MKNAFRAAAIMLCAVVSTEASLITIGTATYGGNDYKLIYDVEDQLTWLDYSNSGLTHPGSLAWAASLNNPGVLSINLDDGYSVSWDSSAWRLAGNTVGHFGYYGSERYIISSEMEALYYSELGNVLNDTSLNFGDFEHLLASYYHMSADAALTAELGLSFSPRFIFSTGVQEFGSSSINGGIYGMAVHPGAVSAVPEPATLSFLALGGLAMMRRRLG